MNKKVFQYTLYGSVFPVYLRVGTYRDGTLAVLLHSADPEEYGAPFCDVTKCVGAELGEYEAAFKAYSENEGMIEFLERNGFGKADGRQIASGYVILPVFRFDKKRLRSVDRGGCEMYEFENEGKK